MTMTLVEMSEKILELQAKVNQEEQVINQLREQVRELAQPAPKLTQQERDRRKAVIENRLHQCGVYWSAAYVYVWRDGKHITVSRLPNGSRVMTYTEVKEILKQCVAAPRAA